MERRLAGQTFTSPSRANLPDQLFLDEQGQQAPSKRSQQNERSLNN